MIKVVIASCVALGVGAAACLTSPFANEAQAQNNCVTLVDNHTFANGCGRMVTVVWTDQGACRGGCSDSIGAESYRRITPISGRGCWRVGWGYNYPGLPHC